MLPQGSFSNSGLGAVVSRDLVRDYWLIVVWLRGIKETRGVVNIRTRGVPAEVGIAPTNVYMTYDIACVWWVEINSHRGAICRVERILIHIYAGSDVIFHVLMFLLQSLIGQLLEYIALNEN